MSVFGGRFAADKAAIAAITGWGETQASIRKVGMEVRDAARSNAKAITSKTDAIVTQTGRDEQGVYADVGYARHHPGFFLWWWEVGTRFHAPRPHLRPALRPRL